MSEEEALLMESSEDEEEEDDSSDSSDEKDKTSSDSSSSSESEQDHLDVLEWEQEKEKQSLEEERRWAAFEREEVEMQQRDREWRAYWKRRHDDDRDLWRDKDFANAVDKISRAGYKGPHGNFDVPGEPLVEMFALYMQVTVGDYDGNRQLTCAKAWKKLRGKTRVESQREFIRKANELLTRYGWNPPEGWN